MDNKYRLVKIFNKIHQQLKIFIAIIITPFLMLGMAIVIYAMAFILLPYLLIHHKREWG